MINEAKEVKDVVRHQQSRVRKREMNDEKALRREIASLAKELLPRALREVKKATEVDCEGILFVIPEYLFMSPKIQRHCEYSGYGGAGVPGKTASKLVNLLKQKGFKADFIDGEIMVDGDKGEEFVSGSGFGWDEINPPSTFVRISWRE